MTGRRSSLPTSRVLNASLSTAAEQEIVKIEVVPVKPGQRLSLTFEGVGSPWRQGVWLATNGTLFIAGQSASQLVVWQDSAPREVEITVEETDGLLRFYNIWDSHRGLGPFESQSATSGCMRRDRVDGSVEYSCNDIGKDPTFNSLVFSLRFA